MKKLMVAAACVAFGVVGVGSVAGANKPVVPNCFGTSVSAQAHAPGPYGALIREFTPRNPAGNLGDAIALVKQGLVDDSIYTNSCND